MSSSSLFSCKVNPQKPFHIYDAKKFAKQPFLIIHAEPEPRPVNSIPNGFIMEEPNYNLNADPSSKPYGNLNNGMMMQNQIQNQISSFPTQIKQISDPQYLQNFTMQLNLLKQQNTNKYFINYNGNSSSNMQNMGPDQNYGYSQYSGGFGFPDREKILSNLALPESVLRKMSSNTINTKFIDKTSRDYNNISKSPDLRKSYHKNSKKDGNLSMDDNKSIDGFLSDEETKENKPIFDVKHLPSPSSGKIINYDELKIYNEDDECLELEDEEDDRKSYASKDFQV